MGVVVRLPICVNCSEAIAQKGSSWCSDECQESWLINWKETEDEYYDEDLLDWDNYFPCPDLIPTPNKKRRALWIVRPVCHDNEEPPF